MFEDLTRFPRIFGRLTLVGAARVRAQLILAIMLAFGLMMVMFIINLAGYKLWNSIIFMGGVFYILAQVIRPMLLGIVTTAGAVVEFLEERSLSSITKGAVQGLEVLYQLTIGVLAGFWIVSGLLISWSFEESPPAFFLMMACVIGFTILMAFFKIPSGKTAGFVLATYTAVVFLGGAYQTLTPDQKEMIPFTSEGGKSQWFDEKRKPVPVDMSKVAMGGAKVIRMHTSDTLLIRVRSTSRAEYGVGNTYACQKVLDEEIVFDPTFVLQKGLGTTLQEHTLSEWDQGQLGPRYINVRLTQVFGRLPPCANQRIELPQ